MPRSLSLICLFGLSCLSLLAFIPTADARGRCRHGQHCVPMCSPCAPICSSCSFCQPASLGIHSMGVQATAQAQACLTCIDGIWQPGNPCVMVPASWENMPCMEMPKEVAVPGRVYKGYGLWYDPCRCRWTWYSNLHSTEYCEASHTWHCSLPIRAVPKGTCENGVTFWDIYVSK